MHFDKEIIVSLHKCSDIQQYEESVALYNQALLIASNFPFSTYISLSVFLMACDFAPIAQVAKEMTLVHFCQRLKYTRKEQKASYHQGERFMFPLMHESKPSSFTAPQLPHSLPLCVCCSSIWLMGLFSRQSLPSSYTHIQILCKKANTHTHSHFFSKPVNRYIFVLISVLLYKMWENNF